MPGVAKRDVTVERADAASALDDDVGLAPKRVPRVLCVDDEPAMLVMLTRALGSRFDVVTLEDPVAALSLLERTRDFAVLISDMKMPRMDGAELLARARNIAPSTTRLALTACLEQQLTSDEAFGILTKPCPMKLLHESVTAAIQHHALLRRDQATARPLPFGAPALGRTELPDALVDSEIRARRADSSSDERDLPIVTGRELPVFASTRLYLQLLGRYAELGPRATLLGRAPDCDIVVNDARIAPRHVRFFNSWRGVTLQDLSRANDVRLNGQTFAGVRHISVGDWISIGPFHAEVRSQRDMDTSIGPLASPPPRLDRAPLPDHAADTRECPLAVLGAVAEKFFLLGQGAEAERVLRPRLEDIERRCRQAPHSSQKDCGIAVTLAVRLAAELRAPGWIDYVFRIFTALGRPLDASKVELLHDVMRQVPGASLSGFREYLRVLAAAQAHLSPAEQFSVRRIEGLEPLMK